MNLPHNKATGLGLGPLLATGGDNSPRLPSDREAGRGHGRKPAVFARTPAEGHKVTTFHRPRPAVTSRSDTPRRAKAGRAPASVGVTAGRDRQVRRRRRRPRRPAGTSWTTAGEALGFNSRPPQ